MSDKNPFLIEIHDVIAKYQDRDAIIHQRINKEPLILKYKDISKVSESIHENLDGTIQNCAVGLYMEHNSFIPSIVLCLQRRNCPFMFIDENISGLELNFIISHNVELDLKGYDVLSNWLLSEDKFFVYKSKNNYLFKYCDINYIIRTSGTTGIQKTVYVEHYCIYSNIKSLRKKLDVTCNDIIYFGTILTFDPSIIELYLALTTGSCLLTVSGDIKNQLHILYKVLFQHDCYNITILQMCPSVFTRWGFDNITHILKESQLRALILGGEDFPLLLKTIEGNKTKIYNIYGITEISCWAFIDEFKIGTEISLGLPLDDVIYELRDKKGGVITNNLEGELFIGSHRRICYIDNEMPNSLSRPIFRSTGDLVFIENDKIFYKGRTNDLIKRFGKRTSLIYVEKLIFEATTLDNKIIYLESNKKLVLFVKLLETDTRVLIRICDKLKVKLLHVLDHHCIPDYIEPINKFPLTKHGKIDKHKLVLLAQSVINCNRKGKNKIETFEYLWKKYLINSPMNSDKSFYDLGGSSILRIQFTNEFKELTNSEPPNHFFDFIFSNTYTHVIKFLTSYNFKRKIILNSNEIKKIKFEDVSMRIKWTFDLGACIDSTATILEQKNFVAVGAFSNIFAIISIENGEEIAKIALPNAIESSCLSSNCGSFIFVGCYDKNLYCIETTTGQIKWSFPTGDRIKNTPCFLEENNIVFCSYDGFLYCVDIKGELSWKVNLKEGVTAKPILLKKNIFVASIHGSCVLLDKNGRILWKNRVSSPVFSSPCVFDDCVIVAEVLGEVHCFNQNGDKKWSVVLNGHIYSPITCNKNNIFLTCHDHYLYCLQVMDSNVHVKFKTLLDSPSCSAVEVCIHDNRTFLITSSNSGQIYAIDFEKQCIINNFKLQGDIYSSPVLYKNHVFIGCRDNNLYCMELLFS